MMANRSLLVLMMLIVGACAWQLYAGHEREQLLIQQIGQLTQDVNRLEQRLLVVETEAERLRSESMGEVVRKANGALLDAWKGLLQKLDQEVDEAREEIERRYDEPGAETDPERLKRT